MIGDVEMLSKAAVEGKLRLRAGVEKHAGDFRGIVAGFNQTLDAVIEPLSVAAEYIDKIGKGKISPKLTAAYFGDFNEIKNSINACIEGLGALEEGKRVLRKMRMNDFTGRIDRTGQGIFSEISESIHEVSGHINEITESINHVAAGDLRELEHLKTAGRKSENDILLLPSR